MTIDNIWLYDNYINPNIPYLFNSDITEYDMEDAGFSLTREFHLLEEAQIESLGRLRKERRTIEIGKIQGKNESFKNELKTAFGSARGLFFIENEIDINDLISIKKDAIITTKKCNTQQFGHYINFRPKNKYSSYVQLEKGLEFYYNPNTLDVKGIGDSQLSYHEDYMINFIKKFFHKMETESEEVVISFIRRFIDKYKRKELEVGYYREFSNNPVYRTLDGSTFEDYWDDGVQDLNITYNYNKILLKLIQIPL